MRRKAILILGILAVSALPGSGPRAARAVDNGLGKAPYMGWSSWSLAATKLAGYGGYGWLTADHLKAQSKAMHRILQRHGYTYLNIDSGWSSGRDGYGRPIPDPIRFPGGIADVAKYVHHNRQKLGFYWIPGVGKDLYDANVPVFGTPYHIPDIVARPLKPANGWGFNYKIDFSKPGSQEYINSIADNFASWGIDFLKLDGVVPGSDHDDTVDARPDVAAWSAALKRTGRPIWLELSWNLDRRYVDYWRRYANGRRVSDDVETYDRTLTGWRPICRRFGIANEWASEAGRGKGWNDLDSLDVGNGAMDGLTDDERQTTMTLWAIACSPLYAGDDLTRLDRYGIQLLTNDEVIAVDRAGHPASAVATGIRQVWRAKNGDGGETVALFNLDDKNSAAVTAKWSDLGLSGPATVRDLWSHADLGIHDGGFTATLAPHASRLLRIAPRARRLISRRPSRPAR